MKKLLATLMALMMTVTSVSVVFGAEMKFTDVKEKDWFYNDVQIAVESGLVNGKTDTTYCPNDNLTYAEAIKLAACMNQLYTEGKITLKGGDPWYMPYVNYCKAENIITKDYAYGDKATRAGYMEIFAQALPDEGLEEINYVEEDGIPDVPSSKSYAPAIYKLYRAGILQGVDKEFNCNPFDNIKRSEVAAILTRMMNAEKRVSFSIGEEKPKEEEPKEEEPKEDVPEEVKPLSAKIAPENITAMEDESVEIIVVAKDGKAPYSYEWQFNKFAGTSARQSRYSYVSAAGSEVEDIEDLYINGEKLSFTATKAMLNSYKDVICTVKDADGNTVTTKECKLTYGGSDRYNDLSDDNFLMYVEDKIWITDRGPVVTGRVVNGALKKGDAVKIYQKDGSTLTATVEGIEMFKKMLDEAKKGDYVGILLGGVTKETLETIQKGYALGGYNDKYIVSDYIQGTFTPADESVSLEEYDLISVYIGGAADVNAYIEIEYDYDYDNETVISLLDFDYTYYGVWYIGQTLNIRKDGKEVGTFVVNNISYPDWLYE